MRKVLLTLAACFYAVSILAQKKIGLFKSYSPSVRDVSEIDSECGCPDNHRFINRSGKLFCNAVDANSFFKIYRKDFSYIVSGIENTNYLSQVSVAIDKPSISLTQTLISDERRSFSGSYFLKGTLSDNLFRLFSSSDGWSPGVSFGLRGNVDLIKLYNSVAGKSATGYYFDKKAKDQNLCKATALQADLQERLQKLLELKKKLDSRVDSLRTVKSLSADPAIAPLLARARIKLDSVVVKLLPDTIKKYNDDRFYELNKSFKWNLRRYFWFSVANSLTVKNYNIFDPTDVKNQNISKKTAWIRNPAFTLSFYQTSELPTKILKNWNFYLAATYSNEVTNDILNDEFNQKYEKEVLKYWGVFGMDTLKTTEKKTFLFGNRKKVRNHKVDLQGIFFFNRKKTYGLDLHAGINLPDREATINVNNWTGGIGFIIPAITSDGKSKLNINVALDLVDVGAKIEERKKSLNEQYEVKDWNERLNLSVKIALPIYKL